MGRLIKRTVQYLCVVLIFPFALLSGFGSVYRIYIFFAHTFACIPGLPGEYCRAAWYHLTLASVPWIAPLDLEASSQKQAPRWVLMSQLEHSV